MAWKKNKQQQQQNNNNNSNKNNNTLSGQREPTCLTKFVKNTRPIYLGLINEQA